MAPRHWLNPLTYLRTSSTVTPSPAPTAECGGEACWGVIVEKNGGVFARVKEASRGNAHVEGAWQTAAGRGRPSWITAGGGDMSATISGLPTRDDVDRSINEQLIVELYSK